METSDEDFLWTDASSDSNKDTNGLDELLEDVKIKDDFIRFVLELKPLFSWLVGSVGGDVEMKQNKSNQGSDLEDSPNCKLHIESVPDEPKKRKQKKLKHDVEEENENDNTNYQVARSIKSEQNSDYDVPKRKKKHQHDKSISNNYDESLYDSEDYLNLRVKQEHATLVEPSRVKAKKKKNRKDEPKEKEDEQLELTTISKNEMDIDENTINSSCVFNGDNSDVREIDASHRKKKKKKREKSSVDNNTNDTIEESKDSNKTLKKKKSKELLQNDESYNISYHLDIGNNEIVSSTLVDNFIQDNGEEQDNSIPNSTAVESITKSSSSKSATIEKPMNKVSRISDRLKFEDDSVDYELKEDEYKYNISKQLQQFINSNSNLKPIQVDVHSDPEISDDDDIWILKGPHDISVQDLENINLTIDGKKKVKISENTYDSIVDTTITTAPLLLFNKKKVFLKNMPLKGVISLHKRVPKVHIPYLSLMTDNGSSFIPLPETKCRHPLFGIDYKKVARVPPGIAKRLNSSEDFLGTNSKKKKKHKKRSNSPTSMSTSDVEVKPNIEELRLSKKNKAAKRKLENGSDFEEKPNIGELHLKKKRKKMKIENDSDFEVKCSIDELYSSKIVQGNQELETEREEISSNKVAKNKKNKSKLNIKTESDIETKPNIEVLHSKKKKRKHSDEKGESKKAKRARYDPSSAAAWESEQAIEENLFDF